MKTEGPRCVTLQHGHHAIDNVLAFGAVVHVAHPFEQTVKLRARIIGRILSAALGTRLRSMQQEHEILRIRVIGIPAKYVQLCRPVAQLFLEAVQIRGTHHELDVDLSQLFGKPVRTRLRFRANQRRIEIQSQWFAGSGINAVGISGLAQQAFRMRHRFSLCPAIDPVVNVGIDTLLTFPVAENTRRQGALSGDTAAIAKDRNQLLHVHRD